MSETEIIPAPLLEAIRQQKVVLFLGAGAGRGADHPKSNEIPDGLRLRDILCDRFLGGQLRDKPLQRVAQICINETNINEVQLYIKQIFEQYNPGRHHLLIPQFYWKSIVTTNFDLIVERAYQLCPERRQNIVKFFKNGQNIEDETRSVSDALHLIKLHGTVDEINDEHAPLILAKEQYAKFERHRTRLFDRFRELGHDNTILFCGYALDDDHIYRILSGLFDEGARRPRYYLIDPSISEYEKRMWEANRITPLQITFQAFLEHLRKLLPDSSRSISPAIGGGTTTLRHFYRVSNPVETPYLLEFLKADVEHVRSDLPAETPKAKNFYTGYDRSWGPILSNYDVERGITDSIIVDAFLADENERGNRFELYVLKGHAGSGKSVTLKRTAWTAAVDFEKPVIFLKETGALRLRAVREILDMVQDRLYIIIDGAADHVKSLVALKGLSSSMNYKITVVCAERENEWNIRCEELENLVDQEYALEYLSEQEINALIRKLVEHDCLGYLEQLNAEQRVMALNERAGRQLLVALHEATLGRPFEDILVNEFYSLIPTEAQDLYLNICSLNRLRTPVRAGLISRVSGIKFEDFEKRFFKPLDHVVRSEFHQTIGDFVYEARHPHIAEIVFEHVLKSPEARYDKIIALTSCLNIDYSTDNVAFKHLCRARNVIDAFITYELGCAFYERIMKIFEGDNFLLHQRGVFELTHTSGRLDMAEKYLNEAKKNSPYDRSVEHSLAVLDRKRALGQSNSLLRDKYRNSARSRLRKLAQQDSKRAHDFHTLGQVILDELREIVEPELSSSSSDGKAIENRLVDVTKRFEDVIQDGLFYFPNDSFLLTLEADFRQLFQQYGRAENALGAAFQTNPRNEAIAIRLSRLAAGRGDIEGAKQILIQCVVQNSSARRAHYEIAQLLINNGSEKEIDSSLHHLQKSIDPSKNNLLVKFWMGRQYYVKGEYENAFRNFEEIKGLPIDGQARRKVQGIIKDSQGRPQTFMGSVHRKEHGYCFIKADRIPRSIFCHCTATSKNVWEKIAPDERVQVTIAFSIRGPVIHKLALLQ